MNTPRLLRSLPALIAVFLSSHAVAQIELISKPDLPGEIANGDFLDMSSDGRRILFVSETPNVVPGQVDPSPRGSEDLFLYDRDTDTVHLVSHVGDRVSTSGGQTFPGQSAAISADGRKVVFSSSRAGLVPGFETNSVDQIFVYDVASGVITAVTRSAAAPAVGGDRRSIRPLIANDGSRIVFESEASNLITGFVDNNNPFAPDVFAYDLATSQLTLVSTAAGSSTNSSNLFGAELVDVTDDATGALYLTAATNLVSGFSHAGDATRNLYLTDVVSGTTELISRSAVDPLVGVDQSVNDATISGDGQRVAFVAGGVNLVTGMVDNSGQSNVFVRDRMAGTTSLISGVDLSPTVGANGASRMARISRNGSRILFQSQATDLLSNVTDDNGAPDLFVYDDTLQETILVTRDALDATRTAASAGQSLFLSGEINADGDLIAFDSTSPDLSIGFESDSSQANVRNVYVFDVDGQATTLMSPSLAGNNVGVPVSAFLGGQSRLGTTIVMTSLASNLVEAAGNGRRSGALFLSELPDQLVEVASPIRGTTSASSDAESSVQSPNSIDVSTVSNDGRFVAFLSASTNLVDGFVNGGELPDLYLADRVTGEVALVNHTGDFLRSSNGQLNFFAVSSDGSAVVFRTNAPDQVSGFTSGDVLGLYRYDVASAEVTPVTRSAANADSQLNGGVFDFAISQDGNRIVFGTAATDVVAGVSDQNGLDDIYLHDVATGLTSLISRSAGDAAATANGLSRAPRISGDGSTVAYLSRADDIVANFVDGNGSQDDVYRYDVATGAVSLVTASSLDAARGSDGVVNDVDMSDDGQVLVFESTASDLLANFQDANGGSPDVYVWTAAGVTLASRAVASANQGANGSAGVSTVSASGNAAVYFSSATDLVDNITYGQNAESYLFRYDIASGVNSLLSVSASDPLQAVAVELRQASASADGSRVVFESPSAEPVEATSLGAGMAALYAHDVPSGSTWLLTRSVVDSSLTSNERAFNWQISRDGLVAVFSDLSSDLVANDLNATADVFAFDLEDTDGDGVLDFRDNCLEVSNADQRDSDGDNFGNACDADLNNDNIVNVIDLGILRLAFFSADADADFNGDGVVNVIDLGVMRLSFFLPPGPSGLVP